MITQETSGAIGGMAKSGMSKISGGAKFLGDRAKRTTKEFATGTVGGTALKGAGALLTKTPLAKVDSLNKLGAVATLAGGGLQKTVTDRKTKSRQETLKKFGLGSLEAQQAVGAFADTRLAKGAKVAYNVGAGVVGSALTGGVGGIPQVVGAVGRLPGAVSSIGAGAFAGYHALMSVASGVAGRGKGKYKDLTDQKNKKIEAADNNYDRLIQPLVQTRDTEIKAAEADRDKAITPALKVQVAADVKSADDKLKIDLPEAEKSARMKLNVSDLAFRNGDAKTQRDMIEKHQDVQAVRIAHKDGIDKANARIKGPTDAYNQRVKVANATFDAGVVKFDGDRIARDNAKAQAQTDYDQAFSGTQLGKVRDEKKKKVDAVNNDNTLLPKEKQTRIAAIDDDYKVKEDNAAAGILVNMPEILSKAIKGYDPNKILKAAVKEGIKTKEDAAKVASGYATGSTSITEEGKTAWYSADGQNDKQKERIKAISGNPTAMANILKELKALKKSNDMKALIHATKNLKQGLAAYSKGGGDISNWSQVITEINPVADKDDDENGKATSVEQYKDLIVKK
jgi:hypothetical protein